MAKNGYTIRQRGTSWQLDFARRSAGGKRIQKSFKTKAKATAWAIAKQQELAVLGKAAFDLGDSEKKMALDAFAKLRDHDFPLTSLLDAVSFYIQHHDPSKAQRTVQEAFDELVIAKQKANRRPNTIHDLHQRIGRFAQDFGDRLTHEVMTQEIEEWLDGKGYYHPTTRGNYIRHLVGFYNFCVKRGYSHHNPALAIEKPSKDEKIPEILSVAEVTALLAAVQKECPDLVPFVAISIFAGLRRQELLQLDRSQIELERHTITVTPETAKRRRTRYVDMSENLVEWLRPHLPESGKLHYSRVYFQKAQKQAGVNWSLDIMRHTYGSYHLAMHNNAALTALQMGHTRVGVLFEHYRQAVRPDDAKAFWEIRPHQPEHMPHAT